MNAGAAVATGDWLLLLHAETHLPAAWRQAIEAADRDPAVCVRVGYADVPIMEDVDLVRRLRTCGRLFRSSERARTSARRWEQDGWARRTARHLRLILLYFAGVPPGRLVRLDRARLAHPEQPDGRISL